MYTNPTSPDFSGQVRPAEPVRFVFLFRSLSGEGVVRRSRRARGVEPSVSFHFFYIISIILSTWCVISAIFLESGKSSAASLLMSSHVDLKFSIAPYSGTPGEEWESFEDALLNLCTTKTDDRGWSLADHLLGNDEGGPNGNALPQNSAAAAQAYRKRQKESYGILTRHVQDADLISAMRSNTFQLGFESFTNLQAQCRIPIDMLRLRELERQWNDIDILNDIGVN
jgi:hypothetical protein